jgi:hypothetical protein
MNDADGKAISCRYEGSENYENTHKMASGLKGLGVKPKSASNICGKRSVARSNSSAVLIPHRASREYVGKEQTQNGSGERVKKHFYWINRDKR